VSPTLFTIGHSNRSGAEFLALLKHHEVARLADVRRYPGSRRHPHFNGETLAASLHTAAIEYRHWPDLGGHRTARSDSPHAGLDDLRLRGYADHMESPAFARAIVGLIESSRDHNLAVMCAEADPAHCHRWLLADALVTRGVAVEHIVGEGPRRPHQRSPWARVEGERLIYEATAPRLPGL